MMMSSCQMSCTHGRVRSTLVVSGPSANLKIAVFDDEHSSISRMYRDLECQHHLVQEKFNERPDIPGLTPLGFERWVTLLIQAHPDEEFERLQKAVLDMPICNPDDRKERFPKELSRRLFPGHEDRRVRETLEKTISEHAAIDLPLRPNREDPPPPRRDSPAHKSSAAEPSYVPQTQRSSVTFDLPPTNSSAPPNYVPSQLERERKPYSNIPSESAIDDTNPPMPPPTSNPIERARQPYTALPGGGKQFEDESKSTKPRAESFVGSAPKPSRSDSTARSRPIPVNTSRPMETPKPELHHSRVPSNTTRRHRSPSFSRGSSNDFRRSEGDFRAYQPSPYQMPASVPVGAPPVDAVTDENDTRRYFEKNARERAERARRQAEEEARSYGESPRRYERAEPRPRRDEYMNDEDYARAGGGRQGSGYDYGQPYGGPVYR